MNKRNLLKLLIIFLTVTMFTAKTYAEDAEQTIILSVSPTVSVQKSAASAENASVDVNGVLNRNLLTIYDIVTNGTDDDYDFTVTSSINSANGPVSAYGTNCILFGHIQNPPTEQAINDAKSGGSRNFNVIAYPVSTTITSPMESTFTNNYKTYGDCFVIKTNDATNATFTHTVSATPVGGTFNHGQDEAGTYQTTVTLTVTPKI